MARHSLLRQPCGSAHSDVGPADQKTEIESRASKSRAAVDCKQESTRAIQVKKEMSMEAKLILKSKRLGTVLMLCVSTAF